MQHICPHSQRRVLRAQQSDPPACLLPGTKVLDTLCISLCTLISLSQSAFPMHDCISAAITSDQNGLLQEQILGTRCNISAWCETSAGGLRGSILWGSRTVSARNACLAMSVGTSSSSSRALAWMTAASPATFPLPLTVAAMASSSLKSPAHGPHAQASSLLALAHSFMHLL